MQTTGNFGLKKPEGTDVVNIDDLNYNADILDQEVAKRIINSGGVPSIQAGLDVEKPDPGTAGRLYIATDTQLIYRDTGTAWQKVGAVKWGDIDGKPTSFTPSAHKSTHATGGSDALTPADIGAVNKAGDTMTGGLTAPCFISNVPTGTAPLQVSSTTVVTNLNADMVDNIHFRISDGVLQYNDGSGWQNVMTSVIKSIQRGVLSSKISSDSSITVTISSVDISKSVVILSSLVTESGGSSYSTSGVYAQLVNSTSLQFTAEGTDSWRFNIAWQVIEYV